MAVSLTKRQIRDLCKYLPSYRLKFLRENAKHLKKVISKNFINTYHSRLGPIITKRGYKIKKARLNSRQKSKIRKDLKVSPYVNPNFSYGPVESINIYTEDEDFLYLPKYYGLDNFEEPDLYDEQQGEDISLEFKGTLRNKGDVQQTMFTDRIINDLNNKGSGYLSVFCGGGKTCSAIFVICKMGKKALILVHKSFLMDQWTESFHKFAPDAKIGRIQGNIMDVEGKDVVLGMLQSVSMRDYPSEIFSSFGMVVIDEAHRINAMKYSQALPKVACKYMLALSATPERADGLDVINTAFIGPVTLSVKRKNTNGLQVECYYPEVGDKQEHTLFNGKINYAKMVTDICQDDNRNQMIVDQILQDTLDGRTILILSARRGHLNELEWRTREAIRDDPVYSSITTGFYVGGMKQSALDLSCTKQVIFSTIKMAREGLDIPSLNTLYFVTPESDIEQCVGRIQRRATYSEEDHLPIVRDFIDSYSSFVNQARKRHRYYRKCGFEINGSKEPAPKKRGRPKVVIDDAGDDASLDDPKKGNRCIEEFLTSTMVCADNSDDEIQII